MLQIAVRGIVAMLFVCLAVRFAPGAEIGPDGMSSADLKDFLLALQAAVRRGDPNHVARYMYFPLRVNSDKGVIHSYGGVTFEKKFDQVFTPALRRAVLAQDPSQMMRSAKGAMSGDGRVWISNVCLDRNCTKRKICVTSINLGDPAHPPLPAAAVHPHH